MPQQKFGGRLAEMRTLIPELQLVHLRDLRVSLEGVLEKILRHGVNRCLKKPALGVGRRSVFHDLHAPLQRLDPLLVFDEILKFHARRGRRLSQC
jgi:hypothetical protein